MGTSWPETMCLCTVRNPWRGVDAGGGDGGVPRLTDSSAAIVYYTVKRALVEARQQAAGGPLSEALRRCRLSRGAAGLSMCEGFFAAATPFCFVFRRHAIFFSVARPFFLFFFPRPGRGPAIFFSFPRPGHFISEVVPRNPGHATHFTKGNENPLGNKLGGGPSGGAHEPPPASILPLFGTSP